jgi:hypothetical protein
VPPVEGRLSCGSERLATGEAGSPAAREGPTLPWTSAHRFVALPRHVLRETSHRRVVTQRNLRAHTDSH